ncbi:MAG: PSD1 and planctomycete cytochrome C domain-containing protein [Pirellula sp.]
MPRSFHRFFGWHTWSTVALCVCWSFQFMPVSGHAQESNRVSVSNASADELSFFENKIRPLLSAQCFECHSVQAEKLKGGLLLDSRASILAGGDSGTAMVPFKSKESALIAAIRYESLEMPPKGKLTNTEIELIERWVEMGAPWPSEPEPKKSVKKDDFDLQTRKQSHWMWQPIQDPVVPDVQNQQWPKQPLDRFLLAKLESAKLAPARPIDRRGLMRRLSFDLLGLPPTPEAVDRFVQDDSPDAIAVVVDTMLKSPQFGERWARHWLDLVRYAESRGHEFDDDSPNAFQYRDYVIRAFNADVPYDQFVLEHIAGDLLESPRLHPTENFNESMLGTGFWFLGEWVHSPVDIRKDETDRFDNMIDVMSKAFLGVTVSCARCHDHKFDAISSRDYYSLTGFLQGSEYRQARFDTIETERRIARELNALDIAFASQIKGTLKEIWNQHRSFIVDRIANGSTSPPEQPPLQIPILGVTSPDSIVVVDYSSDSPARFIQDGFIFGTSVRSPGELILAFEDDASQTTPQFATYGSVRNDPFWNGLVAKREQSTNLKSKIETLPRPGRTLVTPGFELTHGMVSCLVRGNGNIVACVDSHRLVAGPLHGETIAKVETRGDQHEWVRLILTRYIGHRIHLEFTPDEEKAMEIIGVVDGKSNASKVQYRKVDPQSHRTIPELLDNAIASLTILNNPGVPDFSYHMHIINGLLRHRSEWLHDDAGRAIDQTIQRWIAQRSALRKQVPDVSRIAMTMIDGTGQDDQVLIRGSSATPGQVTARRFLEAIDGPAPLCQGAESGRLQLAQRINAPSNPLTSRILVNRVWHHLMGRGIVPTVDDFGVLGQRPSHPELLDHLAVWFDQHGKSIKGLIRMIVLSQAYQMSGQATAESTASDPKNLLWQHVAPKRLTGEAIRDSLLFVSGELDLKMYGESVPIHITNFMDGRGKPPKNGPLDGDKRRSIYIAVRRNFLSPFMLTFDTPNPFSTMGRRNVSNVPAQALIMMNDPFVNERATAWAKRALQLDFASSRERVDWLYQSAFARNASPSEMVLALDFLTEQTRLRSAAETDLGVWADFAHSLVNLKEFVFVR